MQPSFSKDSSQESVGANGEDLNTINSLRPSMEFRIKLGNAQVAIPFDSAEELETRLQQLDGIVRVIQRNLPDVLRDEERVKPGLEGVYYLAADQTPVIVRIPAAKVEAIGLAVFAAEPRGLTGSEIEAASRVKNSLKDYVYNKSYKKYFDARGGKVHLSHEGARWVTEQVIPRLPKPTEVTV